MCIVFLPEIVPYKECEIVLYKGSKVVGLILVGGADTVLKAVYVKKVVPDSPAAKDGRLQPGDQIIKINNSPMERASRNDALQALMLFIPQPLPLSPPFPLLLFPQAPPLIPPHTHPTVPAAAVEGEEQGVESLEARLRLWNSSNQKWEAWGC